MPDSLGTALLHYSAVEAADVGVVSFKFDRGSVANLVPPGFGYLIPRIERSNVLGVVFDSNCFPTLGPSDTARLTVMLRGNSFEHLPPNVLEQSLIEQALLALRVQLGINTAPQAVLAKLHRRCIPQYSVGHNARMQQLDRVVRTGFPISLVGASFKGVAVEDCVKHANAVAVALAKHGEGTLVTGLEP